MTAGQFRWDLDRDRWWWSSGMFVMHGYAPDALAVSAELVLQHKSDQTRARAEAVFAEARISNEPFSNYHQIDTVTGGVRKVLTVGQPAVGGDGVRVAAGFMADLTASEHAASTRAVEGSRRNRAPIEQARGAVMAIYGLQPDPAMALLIWLSRNNNIKLAVLCRRVTAALGSTGGIDSRTRFDRLLTDLATDPAPELHT